MHNWKRTLYVESCRKVHIECLVMHVLFLSAIWELQLILSVYKLLREAKLLAKGYI